MATGPSLSIRNECPLATPANDGLMSAQQAQQVATLSGTVGSAFVKIFVDSTNGNDANNGLTSATAFATADRALTPSPLTNITTAPTQVIFAPGSYTYSSDQFVGPATVGGGAQRVSPLGLIGGFANVFGDLTATAATNNGGVGISLASAQVLVPTIFRTNGYIFFIDGANAGMRIKIANNDASTLFLKTPTASPISIGDHFRVETPNVTITSTNPNGLSLSYSGQLLGMKGITLVAGSGGISVGPYKSVASTEGVVIDLTAGSLFFAGGGGAIGGSFPPPWGSDPNNPFSFLRAGASLSLHDGNVFIGGGGDLVGDVAANNVTFTIDTNGTLNVAGSAGWYNITLLAGGPQSISNPGDGNPVSAGTFAHTADPRLPGYILGANIDDSQQGIINVRGSGSQVAIDQMDISGSTGNQFVVADGGRALLGNITQNGAANASYGMWIHEMSDAVINWPPGSGNVTTLAGTLGASRFGDTTVPVTQTLVQLNTPDGAGVSGFTDAYLNRIEAK